MNTKHTFDRRRLLRRDLLALEVSGLTLT